jgi:NUDIX domain
MRDLTLQVWAPKVRRWTHQPSQVKILFSTPWFDLVEKLVGPDCSPHYSISARDYLSVLAVTRDGMFPLVRQFRPTVEMVTLELPGGHVDEGEGPEEAARKELQEENRVHRG